MPTRRKPAPTKSAYRIKDYLEIIDSKELESGKAKRYDIYRRAGSEPQTDRVLKFLLGNGLIIGNDKEGYMKTKKGNTLLSVLRDHELTGILTRDLSGAKIFRR